MILQETDDLSDPCMLLAAKEAGKSQLRFQLGAVIKRGKTRVAAYNVNKTHRTFGCGRYQTLHAESHCILKAIKRGIDLSTSVLYVFRMHGLNSRPCQDCQALIKRFRIKKVIYTNVKSGDSGEA
jgi:deoxycytidylate deaminase